MPPLGEKMWITNYMDNYNKTKKTPHKFSGTSRYNTSSKRNAPQRTVRNVHQYNILSLLIV
jgi:hypothetical protein